MNNNYNRIDSAILDDTQSKFIIEASNCNDGISLEHATVAIYLYFNRLAKPEGELCSILLPIAPALLDKKNISESISWMIENGLAIRNFHERLNICTIDISEDFSAKIEKITNIQGFAERLDRASQQRVSKIDVTPKGIVGTNKDNYTEMLARIRLAHKSVKYAVMTTEPYEDTVKALESVAKSGVNVYILVANNAIAQKYKNRNSVAPLWKDRFRKIKNVHIRTYDDEYVLELCSSIVIDDSILRLDIYDPASLRSLDGYLIEVRNKTSSENINIIRWFVSKFDSAWKKAYPNRLMRLVKSVFTPFMIALAILACTLFMYFKYNTNDLLVELYLLIIGSTATYVIQELYRKIKSFFVAVSKALKESSK